MLLGETFAFASKSPPPVLVYSKLESSYLLPLRKVLILFAWSPQAFLQINPLSWVLSRAISSIHLLPEIDGRGSELFLRAKDLVVTIELGAVGGFGPPMCTSFLSLKMSIPHRLCT